MNRAVQVLTEEKDEILEGLRNCRENIRLMKEAEKWRFVEDQENFLYQLHTELEEITEAIDELNITE